MDLVSLNNTIPIHWAQHFKGRLSIQPEREGGFLQSHCIGIRAKFIQLLFLCLQSYAAINSVENKLLHMRTCSNYKVKINVK